MRLVKAFSILTLVFLLGACSSGFIRGLGVKGIDQLAQRDLAVSLSQKELQSMEGPSLYFSMTPHDLQEKLVPLLERKLADPKLESFKRIKIRNIRLMPIQQSVSFIADFEMETDSLDMHGKVKGEIAPSILGGRLLLLPAINEVTLAKRGLNRKGDGFWRKIKNSIYNDMSRPFVQGILDTFMEQINYKYLDKPIAISLDFEKFAKIRAGQLVRMNQELSLSNPEAIYDFSFFVRSAVVLVDFDGLYVLAELTREKPEQEEPAPLSTPKEIEQRDFQKRFAQYQEGFFQRREARFKDHLPELSQLLILKKALASYVNSGLSLVRQCVARKGDLVNGFVFEKDLKKKTDPKEKALGSLSGTLNFEGALDICVDEVVVAEDLSGLTIQSKITVDLHYQGKLSFEPINKLLTLTCSPLSMALEGEADLKQPLQVKVNLSREVIDGGVSLKGILGIEPLKIHFTPIPWEVLKTDKALAQQCKALYLAIPMMKVAGLFRSDEDPLMQILTKGNLNLDLAPQQVSFPLKPMTITFDEQQFKLAPEIQEDAIGFSFPEG